MNNKVNFLRGTSTEYAASTKDNDTFYYTTDTKKLYLGRTEITGIEVDDTSTTATDKTWSAKKISDSIPTTLPANGGNADTVDGLHAGDFIPVVTVVNFSTSAKDYAETYKSGAENIEFTWRGYGATDAPDSDGDWFFHAYRGDSNWIRIVAFDIRHTASYEIAKAGGNWGEWKKLSDGGNANTVGNKDITQILATKGWFDGDMDNLKETGSYIVSNAVNSPYPTTWGTALVYLGGTDSIVQIYTLNPSMGGYTFIRHFDGNVWGTWANIADGGNAKSLNGYSITITDVDVSAGSALPTGSIVFVYE